MACPQKSAIFITGSGRCGTSVVSHSFYSAGFPMGSPDEMYIYEGAEANVKGFWEFKDILDTDAAILAYNGCDWDRPPTRPLEISTELFARMQDVASRVPDGFCCKDPRLAVTVEVWKQVFDRITLVACFRNPAGFLRSIAKVWPDKYSATSDRWESMHELKIWEVYNERLLALSRQYPVHWIWFDDSVPALKASLARVISQLGKRFSEGAFDGFYVPEERRFSGQDVQETSEFILPEKTRDIYRQLLEQYRFQCGSTQHAAADPTFIIS
jgi:hypothetical protein